MTPTASLLKQLEEKVNSGGAFLVSRAELLSLIARIRELESVVGEALELVEGLPACGFGVHETHERWTAILSGAALSPKPDDGGEGEK
jgi:hypothetical protein